MRSIQMIGVDHAIACGGTIAARSGLAVWSPQRQADTRLCLPLSYGIIAQHGGRIDMYSAPGQNATSISVLARRMISIEAAPAA